jgi:glutamyl-Q tRNA(Asp) synthetase
LLHLGHAFAALTASAAAAGATFLLRMEDLDAGRARRDYEAAIEQDLAWLGLSWPSPVLRQSARAEAYQGALEVLSQRGLVYPCFCTRKEIAAEIGRAVEAPHRADYALYPGTCRALSKRQRAQNLSSGLPYAMRLDTVQAAAQSGPLSFSEHGAGPGGECGDIAVDPMLLGDIVLARKEMPAAYHLAVVVDDAFQEVTLVTRGNDLFAATHVQRLLQALLGLPAPQYAHHRLILDLAGRKFSKRDASVTLRALREQGVSSEAIRNWAHGVPGASAPLARAPAQGTNDLGRPAPGTTVAIATLRGRADP